MAEIQDELVNKGDTNKKSSKSKLVSERLHTFMKIQRQQASLSLEDGTSTSKSNMVLLEKHKETKSCCGTFCTCLFKICPCDSSISKSRKVVQQAQRYRIRLESKYESIQKLLKWRKLSTGEHQKVENKSYIACKLWVLCFADKQEKNTFARKFAVIKETDPLTDYYDELLVGAEDMGTLTNQLLIPLTTLKVKFESTFTTPGRKSVAIISTDLKYSFISGNSVDDFNLVNSGIRNTKTNEWVRFIDRPDKQEILKDGILEVIDDFRQIRKQLVSTISILREATGKTIFFNSTLYPALSWFKKYHQKVVVSNDLPTEEEKRIHDEVRDHFTYIITNGELIAKDISELVLLTRLCYITFKSGEAIPIKTIDNNDLPYDEVLSLMFRRKFKLLIKWVDLQLTDFFSVPYPDTLRRAPVLISGKNIQLGIFDELPLKTIPSLAQVFKSVVDNQSKVIPKQDGGVELNKQLDGGVQLNKQWEFSAITPQPPANLYTSTLPSIPSFHYQFEPSNFIPKSNDAKPKDTLKKK